MRRGGEFSIMLGANELMNSRLGGSEEALARLACDRIGSRVRPHLLIGGLGMGFTLRAALSGLGARATIDVAELVPAVVAWARGPMAAVFGQSLDDARVVIHETDVARLIEAGRSSFDAILLDVDNGPDGLTSRANDALYELEGLQATRRALRRGGLLGVWSAGPDQGFTRRLRRTGFEVEEIRVRADGKRRGTRHVVWLAMKRDGSPDPASAI